MTGDSDPGGSAAGPGDAPGGPGAAPDVLYLHAGTTPPELSGVRTFAVHRAALAGATVRFEVIGASHRVHAPAWGIHEVASCRPLGADAGAVRLHAGLTLERTVRTPDVAWHLRGAGRPGTALPERAFDLRHRFAPGAVTAIAVGAERFETYHTYPELNLTLYTETTVERR